MNKQTDDREAAENYDQNKPVRVDCGVRGEPCDGCHIPPIDCPGLTDCRPCDANWRAGYLAGYAKATEAAALLVENCDDEWFWAVAERIRTMQDSP